MRIHRDPAALGHAAFRNYVWDAVLGDAKEQVVGHLAGVVEDDNSAPRVQGAHKPVGDERDASLREGAK